MGAGGVNCAIASGVFFMAYRSMRGWKYFDETAALAPILWKEAEISFMTYAVRRMFCGVLSINAIFSISSWAFSRLILSPGRSESKLI